MQPGGPLRLSEQARLLGIESLELLEGAMQGVCLVPFELNSLEAGDSRAQSLSCAWRLGSRQRSRLARQERARSGRRLLGHLWGFHTTSVVSWSSPATCVQQLA